MPKFMLIMRATDAANAAFADADPSAISDSVGKYVDELICAGVLVSCEGLADPSEGVVVDFTGTEPTVTDGPYGETKELFGGYFVLNVASREEAIEWALRAPRSPAGTKTEIRRVPSIDEFPQDSRWIRSERAWRERTGQL